MCGNVHLQTTCDSLINMGTEMSLDKVSHINFRGNAIKVVDAMLHSFF